jgi:hypothetical protein
MRHPLASMSAEPVEPPPHRGLKISWTRKRVLLLVLGVVVFLVISVLLAGFLQAENVERDADLALIQAETKGEVQSMLNQISGCRTNPACVASVKANAANRRTRRPGSAKILLLNSPTAYSLFGGSGRTRFAWTILGTLPVVQCIDVKRTGSFLTGISVHLIGLSAPIPNEADC